MRLVDPGGWSVEHLRSDLLSYASIDVGDPILTLVNETGGRLHIHAVSDRLVRVVHKRAEEKDSSNLTERHRHPTGRDGLAWETVEGRCGSEWIAKHKEESSTVELTSPEGIYIVVDFSSTVKLSWFWSSHDLASFLPSTPFLADFKSAYTYDKRSGRMFHYVQRDSYLPLSEDTPGASGNNLPPHPGTNEFVYGLGETRGSLVKTGRRFTMDARDSLAYDVDEGDPLYKLCPFYLVHHSHTGMWYGMYYNSLVPSVFDFGAEHDFSTGNFRSYTVEHGPLDYYVLLGASSILDGGHGAVSSPSHPPPKTPIPKPRLKDIITQFATLVTPYSRAFSSQSPLSTPALPRNAISSFQTSSTLPRLPQFGYFASSLILSEQPHAQSAILDFIRITRAKGLPVDGLHLSSGYCVDEKSKERMYFVWNRTAYPDPAALGREMEGALDDVGGDEKGGLGCQVMVNVKPWLLENHPWYADAASKGAFVRAPLDLIPPSLPTFPSSASNPENTPARTHHWSSGMGQTAPGSYIDFSSLAGLRFWGDAIKKGIVGNGMTGLWIDNNEFSTIGDDAARVKGEVPLWGATTSMGVGAHGLSEEENVWARQVEERMGWSGGELEVGRVGRAMLTMGMAKASFDQLVSPPPTSPPTTPTTSATVTTARPATITRSAVPGIQAYAHATWSGDNATTWAHLRTSTALTLSSGLSFLPGLYGHDVGGFAGAHAPSGELLVRWCWHAAWHTRFTVHSWKEVSTTLFMYDENLDGGGVGEIGEALREALRWRYALIPMLYSLYVTGYHRRGWPVLRPLLWNHASVRRCLTQDAQFLFGDVVLVAPCVEKGARAVTFDVPFLLDPPHLADRVSIGSDDTVDDSPDGKPSVCWWYDLHGNHWLSPPFSTADSQTITLPAPLNICPTLIRENGILVLAGPATSSVFDLHARVDRRIKLFPSPPEHALEARATSFALVEDDGLTNEATERGAYTEFLLTCLVSSSASSSQVGRGERVVAEEIVYLTVDVVHDGYAGRWNWVVELPPGDKRHVVIYDSAGAVKEESRVGHRVELVVKIE